jgi:hypothetical protein
MRSRWRPAGDFGHHAGVPRVQIVLRGDDIAAHAAAVLDHGGGGLIATGFNAQDQRHRSHPRHIT